jgi:hypothetical protein
MDPKATGSETLGWMSLVHDTVRGSFKQGNESFGFTKGGEFLD